MFNRAKMTVTGIPSVGTIPLNIASVGYQTFLAAGAANGNLVSYTIEDGANWEIGQGTFYTIAESAVTISIASPAVVTLAAHGQVVGNPVIFSTTGALPTGIVAGQVYWIITAGFGSGAFQISALPGGAAVNTTGSQSGTQSVTVDALARTTIIASSNSNLAMSASALALVYLTCNSNDFNQAASMLGTTLAANVTASSLTSFGTSPVTNTQTAGDNSTKIATTAFVATSFAPLASPTFSGTPSLPTGTTATTQIAGTNNTSLATTAFVTASFLTTTTAASTYAPLASPTFSGTPSLPTGTTGVTQATGTNSTALATTAFVQASSGNNSPSGRLTLTSATPVLTASVSGASTIYLTPYLGNETLYWNGSIWTFGTFTELSQTLADATHSPYAMPGNALADLFVWMNGSTPTLSRGPMWSGSTTFTCTSASPGVLTVGLNIPNGTPCYLTSSGTVPTGFTANTMYYAVASNGSTTIELSATVGGTAINTSSTGTGTMTIVYGVANGSLGNATFSRGTPAAIGLVNGFYSNTASITNGPAAGYGLYLGTIATNASGTVDMTMPTTAASGGQYGALNVWNYFNRKEFTITSLDNKASWTYALAAFHATDASTSTNRVSLVVGVSEDIVYVENAQVASTAATAGLYALCGIGLDSVSVLATECIVGYTVSQTAVASYGQMYASWQGRPGIGQHTLLALEASDSTNTTTFYGAGGGQQTCGLTVVAWQ
jgi:hypothetical protein